VVEAPTGDFFTREWAERMAYLTPEQRLDVFSRKPGWEAS
jgi:Icc protein